MTKDKTRLISRWLRGLALVLCFLGVTAIPHAGYAQISPGAQVDVVFVMDTSGSMNDEFAALCAEIPRIVKEMETRGRQRTLQNPECHPPAGSHNR